MKNIPITIIFILLFISCKNDNGYLLKIYEGDFDEVGVKSGYVNLKGDTIIPLGKYLYCYTDTLKNYAFVSKKHRGCIAIDKNENELFEAYWFDNGPDYISEGLFRIRKNGKIGYANEEGRIIIKPQYECASFFEKGKARVTYQCKLIKKEEHTAMKSENWFYIDRQGNRIKTNH